MSGPLEASAVAVRLRRFWLTEVITSPEFAASDLEGAGSDVDLRRVGKKLILGLPFDFGAGDPFAGGLGELLRRRVPQVSDGAVEEIGWEFNSKRKTVRRAQSSDTDIYSPGDPAWEEYAALTEQLWSRVPTDTAAPARDVVDALKLVGLSKNRLWFAARTKSARDALGTVPRARGALVTAVQRFQKNDLPLYRVVIDPSYWEDEEDPPLAWLPTTHTADGPLDDTYPFPDQDGTWADRNTTTWHRGYGGWDGYMPSEDSALEPWLAWTDRHKELLLEAYYRRWGSHLEPGDKYEITWPPEGNLWADGFAEEGEPGFCSDHDAEYVDDCEECEFARAATIPDWIEPAVWHWHVTVETWELTEDDALDMTETERLHFMTTKMDPRDVEYE